MQPAHFTLLSHRTGVLVIYLETQVALKKAEVKKAQTENISEIKLVFFFS